MFSYELKLRCTLDCTPNKEKRIVIILNLTIRAQTPFNRSAVSERLVKFDNKLTAPASNMG